MQSDAAGFATMRINGVDLAVTDQGSGEPLLLVHGSVNDLRSWRRQLPVFAEQYRVIAYSRRYHWPNAQPGPRATYSATRHAEDLATLIETLRVAPVHLAGSSYGAATALAMAIARPGLARSLVLGEPPLLPWLAGRPEHALVEQFQAESWQPAGAALARGDAIGGMRAFLDGVTGAGTFDQLSPSGQALVLDNAPALQAEMATALADYFPALTRARVATLTIPVLLVQGAASPRLFAAVLDELEALLPHAERVVIPNASHGMHTQNAPEYNRVVLDFLERNGGGNEGRYNDPPCG